MSNTGIKSASGILTITGIVGGVVSAVEGAVTSGTPEHAAIYGGGGLLVGLVSVVAKLFHDKGIHIATIEQAGSDIAAQLPQLRTDLSKTVGFIENDVPGMKSLIDSLGSRVSALEAKTAPDLSGIETVVRKVLAEVVLNETPKA